MLEEKKKLTDQLEIKSINLLSVRHNIQDLRTEIDKAGLEKGHTAETLRAATVDLHCWQTLERFILALYAAFSESKDLFNMRKEAQKEANSL